MTIADTRVRYRSTLARIVCLTALAGSVPLLHAQTATKPAAKKAAAASAPAAKAGDAKTLSIGGGSGVAGGPILTRDELRVCLSREAAIRASTAALDGRRTPMDKEKQALATDQQNMVAERASLDGIKRRSDELNERVKAYAARVEAWNQNITDFNTANRSGPQADRQRTLLNKEKDDLQKLQTDLDAERAQLGTEGETTVRTYNAKAADLDARVADWNVRNNALNQSAKDAEAERQSWIDACADRRYREDDEIAIRRGK